jgi:hypothetical protein
VLKNRPWRTGIAGTVWQGEVGVAGGTRLAWHMAPLRSLLSLGYAADFTATSAGGQMGGRLLVHPGGRVVIDHASGAADASLLQALQPDLPFTCDLPLQVEMKRIAAGGGATVLDGTVASDLGSCRAKRGGAATALPALILTAEHVGTRSAVRIAPATQRRRTLVSADVAEDGAVDFAVTPEGAAAMPFLGLPGGTRIQGRM